MDFINKKKLCDTPCNVVILPDYDTINVEGAEDEGFALYYSDSCTMYVAGNMSVLDGLETEEDQQIAIMTSIAHEYIHHIQNVEDREFDEGEAENRAEELVGQYHMIKYDASLQDFVKFINDKKLCSVPCMAEILVISGDGTFVIHNEDSCTVYVYMPFKNVDPEIIKHMLFEDVAYRYGLYLQYAKTGKDCEEEAKKFAKKTICEYYKTKGLFEIPVVSHWFIQDFMNFINKKYLCETYCEAVIVSHSDTLYFNNQDEMLLAAYDTNNNSIYVLDDVPEECFCYVLMSIALEYICYLQHIQNREFNEQEARDFDFAMRTVDEYYKTKGVG